MVHSLYICINKIKKKMENVKKLLKALGLPFFECDTIHGTNIGIELPKISTSDVADVYRIAHANYKRVVVTLLHRGDDAVISLCIEGRS